MSRKDFSNLLQPGPAIKKEKYNHYKPFQEPVCVNTDQNNNGKTDGDLVVQGTNGKLLYDQHLEHGKNINCTQTEHKLNTKWTQTEHKLNTKEAILEKTEHKLNTELNTQLDTKWTQTEHKLNTKTSFSSLVGLQRALIIFIYNECKIARSKTTKYLSVEYIKTSLKVPYGSVKTTLRRLENKKLIDRISFKNGRGGWSSYALPDFLFQELLQHETEHKVDTKWTQSGHKVNTELNTELNTTPPVVSSYINTNYRDLDIPDGWEGIDLTSLETIGFDFSHLVQIYRAYEKTPSAALSPELMQSSIDAFAFDLKNNNIEKTFKRPAAIVLLSLLKKGQPYNSITPDKCISPIQDALNKHNQTLLAQRTKEQQLLQQIKEAEFSVWLEELSEEELLLLCSETDVPLKNSDKLFKTVRKKMAKEKAKDYFDAEIWPGKKQALLASATRKNIQEEVEQS